MESLGILILVLIQVGCQTTSALNPTCEGFVCYNDGKCFIGHSHHTKYVYCDCKHGFHGQLCQYKSCHDFPCRNGGTCNQHWVYDEYIDYFCSCRRGFTGTHCETDIRPCSSAPCGPHGTCIAINHNSNFTCNCSSGYHGNICERNACEKHDNPCGSGVCTSQTTEPYFKCLCPKGYLGPHCEHTVCDIHPCGHGNCSHVNTLPYFSCHCDADSTGNLCEVSLTSTSPSASTTPSPASVTTDSQATSEFRTCDKYSTISNVVDGVTVENNFTACSSGSHSSPEALVINNCNVTSSYASWKQGIKVMDACNGTAVLPTYSPVGIYFGGSYLDALHGGTAGIFFGCLPDGGFKLGVQECDSVPVIKHINGSYFTMDPGVYFAIF